MSNITKRITRFALLVTVLILAFSAVAGAQPFRRGGLGVRIAPRTYFTLGVPFYDPFWGGYYPYGVYPYVVRSATATVRVEAVPKQAEVFIDGYFAGAAGKLRTTPGGHAITLYLPGYRTVTQNIYVAPDATYKMQDTMDKLGPGEVSAPPPVPAALAPAGMPRQN